MAANEQLIQCLQLLNTWLETPPLSFIFHGIFWSTCLIVIAPIVGLYHVIYTIYLTFQYFSSVKDVNSNTINPTRKNKLGIVITGCDSGFGYNSAIALSKRGYTVFAGCYSEDSVAKFHEDVIAFKMDVTNEKDVNSAFDKVSNWLKEENGRVLHGLINNAGTGVPGYIDWNDLSAFRHVMEVNYFAMIRVTKTFLPIFKSQACDGTYMNSRIINMVSVAGLTPVSGPYSGSKYAAEAFSNILRQELKSFKISVVTMNPTFHKTPLADEMVPLFESKIDNLDPALKKQYGQELFNFELRKTKMTKYVTWDIKNVIHSIVTSIEMINPPPQAIVGTDGKYLVMLMRMLPVWFLDRVAPYCVAAGLKNA